MKFNNFLQTVKNKLPRNDCGQTLYLPESWFGKYCLFTSTGTFIVLNIVGKPGGLRYGPTVEGFVGRQGCYAASAVCAPFLYPFLIPAAVLTMYEITLGTLKNAMD